jgi:ammonia channel protein AmtB
MRDRRQRRYFFAVLGIDCSSTSASTTRSAPGRSTVCAGMWGTWSLGVFATGQYFLPGPNGADTSSAVTGLFYAGGASQLWSQIFANLVVVVAVLILGAALMSGVRLTCTLRVSEAGEPEGIDIHEPGTPARSVNAGRTGG